MNQNKSPGTQPGRMESGTTRLGTAAGNFFLNLEPENLSPEAEFEQKTFRDVCHSMNRLMKTPTLVAGAVMPDACPTGHDTIPVGGIVVAARAIHPGFHSADICCSVMASNFGSDLDQKTLLDVAENVTHFGRGGRKRSSGVFKNLEQPLIDRISSNHFFDKGDLKKAQLHLGTQGDGNHFLFVGRSEGNGGVHLVTHHGSRGFGASLFKKGMQIAEKFRQEIAPEVTITNAWIPADSLEGKQYWDALQIVRDWTKLNHTVIHRLIAEQLRSDVLRNNTFGEDTLWNEHNFVFKKSCIVEKSNGNQEIDLFFHAKGATPLDGSFLPDSCNQRRIVPLNMSQPILIVEGKDTGNNLGFAPHGAGRNKSRSKHKEIKRKTGKSDEMIFSEETKGLDIRFYSGKVDISELPSAYKNADQVQKQMDRFELGTTIDRIHPYGCIMAGK